MNKDHLLLGSLIGLVFFVLGSCSFGIYQANKNMSSFKESCTQAGGRVILLRRDSLCVSPDGRIIGDM